MLGGRARTRGGRQRAPIAARARARRRTVNRELRRRAPPAVRKDVAREVAVVLAVEKERAAEGDDAAAVRVYRHARDVEARAVIVERHGARRGGV